MPVPPCRNMRTGFDASLPRISMYCLHPPSVTCSSDATLPGMTRPAASRIGGVRTRLAYNAMAATTTNPATTIAILFMTMPSPS
jgi:hypothetical protein